MRQYLMLSQSGARPAVIKGMCVRDSQMQKPSLSLYFYLISSFQLHVMVVILSQGIRVSPDVEEDRSQVPQVSGSVKVLTPVSIHLSL